MTEETCLKQPEKCFIKPITCPKCKKESDEYMSKILDQFVDKIQESLFND